MSQRLNIPVLGSVLVLAEDWTFTLHRESRNVAFAESAGVGEVKTHHYTYTDNALTRRRGSYDSHAWPEDEDTWDVTLPAGTRLTLKRYYLRGNARDFDSLTFHANVGAKKGTCLRGRFWVKLADANTAILED